MRVRTRQEEVGRRTCGAFARAYSSSAGVVERPAAGQPDRGDMKSGFQGLRARVAGAATGMLTAFWGVGALAQDRIGEPTDWAMDMQPGVTPLRDQAIFFHNVILLPIITIITLFVAGLLAW